MASVTDNQPETRVHMRGIVTLVLIETVEENVYLLSGHASYMKAIPIENR